MIWKVIPEFPSYEASDCGHIRKIGSALIRKPVWAKGGYYKVTLYEKGRVTKQVHRLVAQAHIPNPNNLGFINHIDGNKTNNRISNLEWCTTSENQIHACRTGLVSNKGSQNGFSKLCENDVIQIRKLYNSGVRVKDLAKKYNVKSNTISMIVHRKSWKHVK